MTFGPLKATERLMWPPGKMSLTPLLYTITPITSLTAAALPAQLPAGTGQSPRKNPLVPQNRYLMCASLVIDI